MKSLSCLDFLHFGHVLEPGAAVSEYSSKQKIALYPEQSYLGDALCERTLVRPLSGIGCLVLQQKDGPETFFLDREVLLNPGISFTIYTVSACFEFELCSRRLDNFFLCKKNAPKPEQKCTSLNVQNILLKLSRREDRNCFIPETHHELYELCYIESGHLFHVIEGQTFLLGAGELQFFLPGQHHHQYGYQEEAATFFTLIFAAEFNDEIPMTNKIYGLNSNERHLISLIQEESLQNRILSETLCQSYLTQLLVSLQRQIYDFTLKSPVGGSDLPAGQTGFDLVNDAIHILNKSPGLKAETLARQLGVSDAHLSRLVSQQTGKSISTWRKEIRMEAAKDFLRSGNSVGETALLLQYPSTSYFSSEFSKFWGMTPRAYTKQFQQKGLEKKS